MPGVPGNNVVAVVRFSGAGKLRKGPIGRFSALNLHAACLARSRRLVQSCPGDWRSCRLPRTRWSAQNRRIRRAARPRERRIARSPELRCRKSAKCCRPASQFRCPRTARKYSGSSASPRRGRYGRTRARKSQDCTRRASQRRPTLPRPVSRPSSRKDSSSSTCT